MPEAEVPDVNSPDLAGLERALRERVAGVDVDAVAAEIAPGVGIDNAEAAAKVRMYLNESFAALRLVGPHLTAGARLLEVGSGIGFFAAFLRHEGLDVTDLEPVGGGFEFIGAARRALTAAGVAAEPDLPIGVDDLQPDAHGSFDLVFSLNVLEHVPDWRHALARMTAVLGPGGQVLQSCPNYTFPYEPHFGVPLVPFAPRSTARLLPHRITASGLWASLNWITSRQVRRWAIANGATVDFRRGQLADALDRALSDQEFARRHSALRPVVSLLGTLRITRLVRRLPAGVVSPMQFTLTPRP